MKKIFLLTLLAVSAAGVAYAQLTNTTSPWTINSTGQWPSGAGILFSGTGDQVFGLSGNGASTAVSLQLDGSIRQTETGSNNYFMAKIGQGFNAPLVNLHIQDGVPAGSLFGLNGQTKIAIDAANGGLVQFRTSMNNGVNTGLVFSDDNIGGYLVYRNDSDEKLHLGGYSGFSFEIGAQNTLAKTEALKIGSTGRSYFNLYPTGAAGANAYSMEIGGTAPTQTNGQATIFMHHHGVIAHQLRYTAGNLYLEGAGNGYGTSTTPNFFVGGNVGIGIASTDAKLTVNGDIHAKEVRVNLNSPGPDYVFEKEYSLPTIESVKAFINDNKHLPEIPSAKEMEEKGINTGEMNILLLKKIEELTLYVIDLKEEVDSLKKQVNK